MIQQETKLRVADRLGRPGDPLIRVKGGHIGACQVGDVITATVSRRRLAAASARARCVQAVIVRTEAAGRPTAPTSPSTRRRPAYRSAAQSAPGTRIFGPVARELRDRNFMKIVFRPRGSLADGQSKEDSQDRHGGRHRP